jgi:hypothetical protein
MSSLGDNPDTSENIRNGQSYENRGQEAPDNLDKSRPQPATKDVSGAKFIVVMVSTDSSFHYTINIILDTYGGCMEAMGFGVPSPRSTFVPGLAFTFGI